MDSESPDAMILPLSIISALVAGIADGLNIVAYKKMVFPSSLEMDFILSRHFN